MPEPVRQVPLNDRLTLNERGILDRPGRTQPGPLRDWLASMKATTAGKGTITIRPAPEPEPSVAPTDLDDALMVMPATEPEIGTQIATETVDEGWPEATPAQTARPDMFLPEASPPPAPAPQPVVQIVPPPAPKTAMHSHARIELTRDLSELMAENLMLKTRLRLENERYEALQAMLADEMRILRGDAEADMKILDTVCAERDQLKSLTANAARKMHEMSARIESEVAQLAEMRSERDLWMARAEALAQPLFQRR